MRNLFVPKEPRRVQSIPKDIEPPAATAETTTTTRATTANRVSSMSQRRERLTRDFESGTTCTPTKFLRPSSLFSYPQANMSIGLACRGERLQR